MGTCFVSLCWYLLCVNYSNNVSQWDPFQHVMKVLPSLGGSDVAGWKEAKKVDGNEGDYTALVLPFPFCCSAYKPLSHVRVRLEASLKVILSTFQLQKAS